VLHGGPESELEADLFTGVDGQNISLASKVCCTLVTVAVISPLSMKELSRISAEGFLENLIGLYSVGRVRSRTYLKELCCTPLTILV